MKNKSVLLLGCLSLCVNTFMTISANKLYDTVNVESFLALNVIPGLYNNRIPPYDSVSIKVEVFVTYKLKSIIEMNEVQGTMTTAGYLTVTWIDIRLISHRTTESNTLQDTPYQR